MNIKTNSLSGVLLVATASRSNAAAALERKILSFMNLKEGWCYGRGEEFSEEIIARAMFVANVFGAFSWNTEAFPGPDGDIALSGKIGSGILRVAIEAGAQLDVELRENQATVTEGLVPDDALYYLISTLTLQWNTFASFIPTGGAHATVSGMTLLSSLRANRTAEASQYWMWYAQQPRAVEAPAVTWKHIRNLPLEPHTLVGGSTARYFRDTLSEAKM